MRIFTYISTFFLALAFFASCINNKNRNSAKDRVEGIDLLVANVVGVYSGDLPCVDCDAIRTVLEINRNHSYKLTYMYQGKSPDQFVKEGNWIVDKNKLVLKGVDYKYKIGRETLVQLDLSGNEITGDIAESYQLARLEQ